MPKSAPEPVGVARPAPPYSNVIEANGFVFVAGQTAAEASGRVRGDEIREQTDRALENMGRCLAAAGCTFEDVVKVNAFLANLDDFDGYNESYRHYFREPYPVRATVGVKLIGVLVEIECVAVKPG